MGDGLKLEVKKSFYPVLPPTMVCDPVEKPCFTEPNPDPNASLKKRRRKKKGSGEEGGEEQEEEEE